MNRRAHVQAEVEVPRVILLEEAISRYAVSVNDFGIRVKRRRRPRQAAQAVLDLEQRLAPLRLPAELRTLWTDWSARSFGSLFFDGLYRLEEAVRVYDRDTALGFPRAVMPLAYIEKAGVWIELETSAHPGGRIYHTFYDDAELQLWCVDISTLIHLVAETVESGGVKDADSMRPWIDVAVFDQVRLDRTADLLAMPDEWRIQVSRRDLWPDHWSEIESVAPAAIDLRGRTHTVEEFDQARMTGRVTATLVGRITGLVSGGPIEGLVLSVADRTGSIQLYVSPELEAEVSGIGLGSQAELEVVGEPGSDRDDQARTSLLSHSLEHLSHGHLRFLGQMRKLDVWAAVTAVRSADSP